MSLQIGDNVGDYEVLGVLGQGGMGAVYRVRNLLSDREEALKLVLPHIASNPEAADRFLREIRIQASLQHPNIAALRTAVRVEQGILMIMELIDGPSLEAKLREGPMPLSSAIRILDDVLGALAYAHSRGVIHRDIKPPNILLTSRGMPKLTDFGIARATGSNNLTRTGNALGSVNYMSPEQIMSKPADERSDLYSLGVTFYEMLTGRRPIDGDSEYAVMNAHMMQTPIAPNRLVASISTEISDVALKALAKSPADRYQSAIEFQSALRDALLGIGPPPPVAVETRTVPLPVIPPADLLKVEAQLVAVLGPIGKSLVVKSATKHATVNTLCEDLAQQIPDSSAREAFLRAVGGSGSRPSPTPLPSSSPARAPIDEKILTAARKSLATYVGPMATVMVNKTAKRAGSIEEFKMALAAEIADEKNRRTFLDSF
jgi:eukaryotic-like serine/threonine-protein kinase